MFRKIVFATAAVVSLAGAAHAQQYQIAGTFEGCDYDRLYKLTNGQILTLSQLRPPLRL
jgi:hypothetical protein